jgi:hypothetical protein
VLWCASTNETSSRKGGIWCTEEVVVERDSGSWMLALGWVPGRVCVRLGGVRGWNAMEGLWGWSELKLRL